MIKQNIHLLLIWIRSTIKDYMAWLSSVTQNGFSEQWQYEVHEDATDLNYFLKALAKTFA